MANDFDDLLNFPGGAIVSRVLGDTEACLHPNVTPDFNGKECRNENDVHRLYPRFDGICPDCGERCVVYASFEHFLAGDW